MTLVECQKKAKEGDDKFEFRLVTISGTLLCRWLDAWYGMFEIIEKGKESNGFIMTTQLPKPPHEYSCEIVKKRKDTKSNKVNSEKRRVK